MAERQAGPVLESRPRMEETVDLMRARDVTEIKVRNPEGEGLGDLTDIAIDRASGCIAYAVLAYGGILGFGEKHFAIPWEAVRIRSGEKIAVVDADKRTLDSASGFSRDTMPPEGDWSLIRTPPARRAMEPSARGAGEVTPPSRVEGEARPAESTLPGGERDLPPQPAVQTVAGGWGGQPTGRRTEERPARAETRPGGAVVEEIRREEPAPTETRPMAEAERPLTTRGPSPGHLSAADLQVYLKGMDYPAGRQDLVARARTNGAPDSVITTLEGFSDRTYRSAADVSEEFGSETRGGRTVRTGTAVEEAREETPAARTRAPSLAHLSAADLQVYLKGMNYPAGRQDLVAHARKNNAPDSVTMALEGFSDRTYHSAADVSVEFGREARGEHPTMETRRTPEISTEEVRREEVVRTETVAEERRETRRARPSLAHLSAADLQVYLKGMDYPAGRQELIAQARKNNAPDSVIAALEEFGDRTYRSAAEVSEEFGNVK